MGISSWVGLASDAMRKGRGFDPGLIIEQRVLRQIEESMREGEAKRSAKADKKHKGGKSVADEIDRLRALRDDGALTDEQYQRAVDRLLSEG
jgi:putative oligomerization/nucleic acid binding protein